MLISDFGEEREEEEKTWKEILRKHTRMASPLPNAAAESLLNVKIKELKRLKSIQAAMQQKLAATKQKLLETEKGLAESEFERMKSILARTRNQMVATQKKNWYRRIKRDSKKTSHVLNLTENNKLHLICHA